MRDDIMEVIEHVQKIERVTFDRIGYSRVGCLADGKSALSCFTIYRRIKQVFGAANLGNGLGIVLPKVSGLDKLNPTYVFLCSPALFSTVTVRVRWYWVVCWEVMPFTTEKNN